MKIAFTSSDGVFINRHFGESESFYVFSVTPCKSQFIGKRKLKGLHVSTISRKTGQSRIEVVYSTISDCSVLYTARIGDDAREWLNEKGINTIVYHGDITDIIPIKNLMVKKKSIQ